MMCTRIFHTPASCQQAAGFVRKESIFAVSAPMGHAHISPGQRPGFGEIFSHKPCKGETGGCDTFVCDALTGLRLYFAPIPRALPWAGTFWPFRPDSEWLLLFSSESVSLQKCISSQAGGSPWLQPRILTFRLAFIVPIVIASVFFDSSLSFLICFG